jgi:hypothetical protein
MSSAANALLRNDLALHRTSASIWRRNQGSMKLSS